MTKTLFDIENYRFDETLSDALTSKHYAKDLWPIVYILRDEETKELYVGETTDASSRLQTHLKNKEKKHLTSVQILTCDKFNKSATLDIESNLIKYLAGDGNYRLLNGNLGLANHTYYEKYNTYWDIFKNVWDELISRGVAKKPLGVIDNDDLFKYSPYKSLSTDQMQSVLNIMKALCTDQYSDIVIEGGAGTGKSILAIYLFKLLNSKEQDFELKELGESEIDFLKVLSQLRKKYPNPKMALVIPMDSFRTTLKKAFKNIKGLKASMVIGPAEVSRNKYDIIVVDESHRLRKRVNLGTYFGAFDKANERLGLPKSVGNELDWVVKQGKKTILFYDKGQSIKPSDVSELDFNKLKNNQKTIVSKLTSQFRVKGGVDYITYIDNLLNCRFRKSDALYSSKEYEFVLFDSLSEMEKKIKERNDEVGLARMVAGYSWKWVSRRDSNLHDIIIGDVELKWNSVKSDFINSSNSINEVGCIHTTQGYDLNYTGIIFGNEISYDKEKGEIIIKRENYHDKTGHQGIKNPSELKEYIINIYKTLMLRGIKGTYVYVCDESLREYFKEHIVLSEVKEEEMVSPYTEEMVEVSLVGSAPCGEPLLGENNIEEMIMVGKSKMRPGANYFIVMAEGDSMNKAGINDGDLVLCRFSEKAETGDRVVALLGGENVTIKYYDKKDGRRVLLPKSTNPAHQPIMPEEGDTVQGIVQEVLKKEEAT